MVLHWASAAVAVANASTNPSAQGSIHFKTVIADSLDARMPRTRLSPAKTKSRVAPLETQKRSGADGPRSPGLHSRGRKAPCGRHFPVTRCWRVTVVVAPYVAVCKLTAFGPLPPWSGVMNPNPFDWLKNLTVPFCRMRGLHVPGKCKKVRQLLASRRG